MVKFKKYKLGIVKINYKIPKFIRFFFNIFLLFIAFFLGLIVSEIIAKCYLRKSGLDKRAKYLEEKIGKKHIVNIGCYDEFLGWGYQPNSEDSLETSDFKVNYKINSKGLRDEECDYDKKEGIYRIIALGDSFTFGEGVNFGQRYTEIIEKTLNNVDIVNMGVQGFGIDQALLYLEKEGRKYAPDMVVLFINNPGIDRCGLTFGNAGKPRFELDDSGEKIILRGYPLAPAHNGQDYSDPSIESAVQAEKKNIFFEETNLFQLIKVNSYEIKFKERMKNNDRRFWRQIYNNVSEARKGSLSEEQLNKVNSLILDRYLDNCKQLGARLLVVNIDKQQLISVEDFCRQKGIAYFDLSNVLIKAEKFKRLQFEIDPHYNEFADRIIGEYVAEHLKDKYSLERNERFAYQFFGKF